MQHASDRHHLVDHCLAAGYETHRNPAAVLLTSQAPLCSVDNLFLQLWLFSQQLGQISRLAVPVDAKGAIAQSLRSTGTPTR